ncbi:SegH [Salmonella phage KM16]|uniref:SegH n=1 Tax=Salmonella phage KM16 TaxID=2797303 RepID=UPI002492D5D6|nr:SegH [Salmonella phage KM16]
MHKYYIVYKITNIINSKEYIGAHSTDNINDGYMGSGKLIQAALLKYGRKNFYKEILHVFDNERQMYNKEAELVTEEYCSKENTYNIKPGGKGGTAYEQTLEHRRKNSLANKGKKRTAETKIAISNALKKYKRTPEHQTNLNKAVNIAMKRKDVRSKLIGERSDKDKISISNGVKKYYNSLSEEERELHRQRIIEGKKSYPMSIESRQKLSKSLRGLQVGSKNPMYGKISPTSKTVSINGIKYDSIKKCSNAIKVSRHLILKRCNSTNEVWKNWMLL